MREPAARGPHPTEVALLASVFVVAACGLLYELAAGAIASYVLGDSVLQFSTIIGSYLFAMGIGSYLSRFFERQLPAHFLRIELLVALAGGLLPALLFLANAYVPGATRHPLLDTLVLGPTQVRLNEQPLTLANRAAAGSKLQVAIRPEAITLGAPHEPYPGQHGVEAQIDQVEFLGAAQRLICTADTYLGPQQILVERPTHELPHHEQGGWRSGMRCSLHWPAGAMQLFEGERP